MNLDRLKRRGYIEVDIGQTETGRPSRVFLQSGHVKICKAYNFGKSSAKMMDFVGLGPLQPPDCTDLGELGS